MRLHILITWHFWRKIIGIHSISTWHIPEFPALERMRQESLEFKTSLTLWAEDQCNLVLNKMILISKIETAAGMRFPFVLSVTEIHWKAVSVMSLNMKKCTVYLWRTANTACQLPETQLKEPTQIWTKNCCAQTSTEIRKGEGSKKVTQLNKIQPYYELWDSHQKESASKDIGNLNSSSRQQELECKTMYAI